MKRIFAFFLLITLVGTLAACKVSQPTSMYYYTDQNNNQYTISPSQVVYTPIRAQESSSGVYSGGAPASTTLQDDQYKAIAKQAEALLSDISSHSSKRIMTTAVLRGKFEEEARTVILRKSEARTKFETLLRAVLKRN